MIGFRRCALIGLIGAGSFAAPTILSDRVGVYAVVDSVRVSPATGTPTTIQVWGVFSVAQSFHIENGQLLGPEFNAYFPARRGYVYYAVNRLNEAATLAEWADLRAVAGTGEPIGFGARFPTGGSGRPTVMLSTSRVRSGSELPTDPDTFPIGVGVVRLAPGRSSTGLVREVLGVPAPISPADGGLAKPGRVRLTTRNVNDSTARYVFEIQTAAGQREKSAPVRRGRAETFWSPRLELRDGEEYTWRVWTVAGDWQSQPAVSTFRAKK